MSTLVYVTITVLVGVISFFSGVTYVENKLPDNVCRPCLGKGGTRKGFCKDCAGTGKVSLD